jgi:DMSO/TMAO reductase YedYZ heme-binding membrane subunit
MRLLSLIGILMILLGAWHADRGLAVLAEVSVSQWTGYGALVFLMLSQAMRPLRRLGLVGSRVQAAGRRDFGIAAALVATLHLLWGWQRYLHGNLLDTLGYTPWVQAGMTAWILLLLLWLTSYPRVVRWTRVRLWKPLHWFAYLALGLAWLHLAISPWSSPAWARGLGCLIVLLWMFRLPRHLLSLSPRHG